MIKNIFLVIKRIIIAALVIYAYNSLAISLNIVIPVNFFNVVLVSCFGMVAMFELILFSFFF